MYWSGRSLNSRVTRSNSVMVGGAIIPDLPQLGFPRFFAIEPPHNLGLGAIAIRETILQL